MLAQIKAESPETLVFLNVQIQRRANRCSHGAFATATAFGVHGGTTADTTSVITGTVQEFGHGVKIRAYVFAQN